MALEEIRQNAAEVSKNTKAYTESTLTFYKLKVFRIAMKSVTMLVKFFMFAVLFLIVLFFISLAGALALGNYFGSYTLGFVCVGGIYVLLGFVLYLIKGRLLEAMILGKFSEIFFKD